MRFWTIQTYEAWEEALALGHLIGNPNFIWEDFLEPYQWMMDQMRKRLPNYQGEYPIWLWPKRPDLRYSGYINKGEKAVLLSVDMKVEDVLLSDFQAWHLVLCNEFLSLTEEEDQLVESGNLSMSKEESWERIFNYKELSQCEYWKGTEDLQGVTGGVALSSIKYIQTFIGS
ncbi:DUF3841 domain-containing protein [Paenibacillus planticolens]|uniref:DUF3841 domain-containing protein n=1 Tax=Paenibacillus planticolens TaxID=2654976 RepID=A0ABX1ZF03_9BACL|nr:DUF3841 domain-containing protein [Paenibacillus planticolens]NOU98651.1 DUF3841 domain-containing protein [Paenibacillus planticolens]